MTLPLEVALLEAEADLRDRLIADRIIPPGARRDPTPVELAAAVRFAELDRIVLDTAALVVRRTDRVRDHVLDGLTMTLGAIPPDADPWQALDDLSRLTDPTRPDTIPGLTDVVDEVTREVTDDYTATTRAGAAEAIGEGRRQGLPDRLLPTDLDPVDDRVTAAARANAARVAKEPASRLLDVAAEAGARAATLPGASGFTVVEAALDAAEQASRAGTEDLARQGANVAHGQGRAAAQAALPEAREVYASELLDSSTCGPCATIDGRTYESLEAGLVDYPGAGGFIGCDGGSRCRGTLVLVHSRESAPTLNNPGDGRGGPPPVDRTPRGPSGVPRPPQIGPDGSLIPIRPDKGTPPPSDLATAPVDDNGRTTMPPGVEDPIDTVAPADVDRDPALAQLSDRELDDLIVDPTADQARVIAACDELDQRAAGTRTQVYLEDDLDAETLARYETEREAWEKAGGFAADATVPTGKPAGRLIDRVRDEWAGELEMQYLAAEDATRGVLIRRDRLAEFQAKYGASSAALFEGPARTAYYYASRELRDHWESLPQGRMTFAEYAVDRGIVDAKMTRRAQAAREAKDDAANRADESATGKAKRAKAKTRKRLPLTEGDRFAREQRRRDRARQADRKFAAETGRTDVPEESPDAPTA